ncbi:MAG: GNAT family N-acetyltransferase [Cyanobacteria bacterium J06626_14]
MLDSLIRQAVSKDLPALSNLDHVARNDSDRRDFIRDAIKAHRAWVLEVSTRVVGYGIISHEFFGRSFLDLIYIAESHRSRGFGPSLVAFLENQSRSNNVFTSTNQSNSHMQHVLEKLGYERSGIIHNLDPDDPEIVYVKRSVRA